MADDTNDHDACVASWMKRATVGLAPDRLLRAFEQALAALWARAQRTLGAVTLTAIGDRVLHDAAERYPELASLQIDATGMRCGEELHEHAAGLHRDRLADAIRFVLVEFLTVLGNLTADILTPALHAELSKVTPPEPSPAARGPGTRRRKARKSKRNDDGENGH